MSELQDAAQQMQERMLKKSLYVVLTRPLQPAAALAAVLPRHLEYMIGLEKSGVLFASGPFVAGQDVGDIDVRVRCKVHLFASNG